MLTRFGNFDYQAKDIVALVVRVLVDGTPLDVYVTHLFMSRGDNSLRLFSSWPLHSKTCTATRLARSHIPSGTSDDAGRICKTISSRAAYITRTDSCTVERSLASFTAGLPGQ